MKCSHLCCCFTCSFYFHKDIREFLGCPVSLFLSQYSFVKIGNAKNGCPVNYFKAGKINPEGILCVTTIKQAASFFWYQTKVKFKEQLKAAHEANPDFVRMEGINIIDLKGLSASVLSSETMDVVKLAGVVSDFFVEVSHYDAGASLISGSALTPLYSLVIYRLSIA